MSSKPSAVVKKITVDVRATSAPNGEVEFDCRWKNDGDPNGWQSGPILLPHGPEHYRLVFDLDDKSGRKLEFYEKPAEAMYVKVGSCPSEPGNGDRQIDFEQVDLSKKKLTIKDYNRDSPCSLHYMLRFDGDPHGVCPPYQYDPEIRNGGGGIAE